MKKSKARIVYEEEAVIDGPVCVRLAGEQVVVVPTVDGLQKYLIRIEDGQGGFRPLTREEELAWAAAPGTSKERAAASARVDHTIGPKGILLNLVKQPWADGEIDLVFEQIARGSADADDFH